MPEWPRIDLYAEPMECTGVIILEEYAIVFAVIALLLGIALVYVFRKIVDLKFPALLYVFVILLLVEIMVVAAAILCLIKIVGIV